MSLHRSFHRWFPETWLLLAIIVVESVFLFWNSWIAVAFVPLASFLLLSWGKRDLTVEKAGWSLVKKYCPAVGIFSQIVKISAICGAAYLSTYPLSELLACSCLGAGNFGAAKLVYTVRPLGDHPEAVWQMAAAEKDRATQARLMQFYIQTVESRHAGDKTRSLEAKISLNRAQTSSEAEKVVSLAQGDPKLTGHSLNFAMFDLARTYEGEGKIIEAENLYKQALADSEKNYGPNSSEVAEALGFYACFLEEQQLHHEAAPLRRRSAQIEAELNQIAAKLKQQRTTQKVGAAISINFLLIACYFFLLRPKGLLGKRALATAMNKFDETSTECLQDLIALNLYIGNLAEADRLSQILLANSRKGGA